MALIAQKSGCKIGWKFYDNEPEARASVEAEAARAERMAKLGYDFGWSSPGSVTHISAHAEYGECWMVVTA